MKIFKAKPIPESINEHHWEASDHRGWVIIRAESIKDAEMIAATEFGIMTRRVHRGDTKLNPWLSCVNYTEMTKAEIEKSNYSIEGEERILDKE